MVTGSNNSLELQFKREDLYEFVSMNPDAGVVMCFYQNNID